MEKGELIGKGMTAEVYEWGPDKVLKLYFDRISDAWIKSEADIGHVVHEAGLPSPAVFDMVNTDDRRGIVFQKIHGRSMMKLLETEPWKLGYFAQQLGDLQYKIHQHNADELPTQKEKFTSAIKRSSAILGDKKKRILEYLEMLPDGLRVCHGDLHFNNIMVTATGTVAIDWANAYKGNPLGDIARTSLMMSTPAVPPGTLPIMGLMTQYTKLLVYWIYLNEYMYISKSRYEDIDAWMLPVAAARLRDKIPGEDKWLMGIIDERLLRF